VQTLSVEGHIENFIATRPGAAYTKLYFTRGVHILRNSHFRLGNNVVLNETGRIKS